VRDRRPETMLPEHVRHLRYNQGSFRDVAVTILDTAHTSFFFLFFLIRDEMRDWRLKTMLQGQVRHTIVNTNIKRERDF